MSNEEVSTLKRGIEAAFGEENDQKVKKSRRGRSKASKTDQDSVHGPGPAQSESTPSEVRNEPTVTRQPTESDQNEKQVKHKPSKASKPQQQSVQRGNPVPLASTPSVKGSEPKAARRPSNSRQTVIDSDTQITVKYSRQLRDQEERGHSKKKVPRKQRSSGSGWTITAAGGGRFANHDPVLVQGDRYLILAVRTQIFVYSIATSLLLRSLRVDDGDEITSYIICGVDDCYLFVSTYSGVVRKWNWAIGQEIKQWRSSEKLLCIAEQLRDQKSKNSTLLLIHEGSDQERRLTQATVIDSSDNINEEVILEHKSLASWVKPLDDGRCLVLHAGDRLLLGQSTRKPEGIPLEYTWREVELPQSIKSIDARAHSLFSGTNQKHLAVDIVVGCQNGSILIYDDVLFKLTSKEKNSSEDDVVARRLHWHRNEVSTVKWSLDGNYIISGGHETVMVIWQLDTGQQQFLPHLSAAIQELTVSQTGAAYAVHLADNSVLVLSTSELQPSAYISGLALRKRRRNGQQIRKSPAVLDHQDSTTMALAVPADYPVKSATDPKATLLQNYDILSQRQTNRQALVRNNITALNVGPLGNSVQEPDVTHMMISRNGKWLATIDEWAPPEQENASLHSINDDLGSHGKEIFLKFWARNYSTRSWELVTKIENPHSIRTRPSIPILDLQANPHRPEFSTISASGSINIWTPKSRHRSGLPVKDKSGSQLYTWTCKHTLKIHLSHQLKTSTPTAKATQPSCSLAYSPDGSVLATSSNASRYIHFIDPTVGHIHHTQAGSHPGPFSALIFLNHHLITISKDLRVYNTVSGDLLYALALSSSVSGVLLAANGMDGTFAVVLQVPGRRAVDNGKENEGDAKEGMADGKRMREGKVRSQIMVFDLKNATPIFRNIVDGSVEVLLSLQERGESGYVIVNDKAEVAYLRTKQANATLTARQKMEPRLLEDKPQNPLEDLSGPRKHTEEIGAGADEHRSQRMLSGVEGDGYEGMTHKTYSSLNDVFNRCGNLPVRELFEQVVRVLKGRGEEVKTKDGEVGEGGA